MTDPMFNPETSHGIECLCDECMRIARFELEPVPQERERLEREWRAKIGEPRVIKRVMTDGISTKDGLS